MERTGIGKKPFIKFQGKPAPVNIKSHPKAGTWRIRLKEGSKEGPNFADHITIVTWGCGTDCSQIAFVDARNGQVYFDDKLAYNVSVNIHDDVEGQMMSYRRDQQSIDRCWLSKRRMSNSSWS